MTRFDAAYHRERRRIREARKKLAYDTRWSKGEQKVRQANYRARKQNADGILTLSDWQMILDRQRSRCALCNELATELDHIFALSFGGNNESANVQGLCESCYATKTTEERQLWRRRAKEL